MSRTAEVLGFERTEAGAEVKVDPGGAANKSADHYADSGVDAPPLPGDFAALTQGSGQGREQVTGYLDPNNVGVAAEGERRTYARDATGAIVAEIWAKANGDISITSLKAGGKINLNGFEIDQDGNATTPGEVTAKETAPGVGVKVSTHLHPTAMGPSGAPTPGT